jgi:hypothetical protein
MKTTVNLVMAAYDAAFYHQKFDFDPIDVENGAMMKKPPASTEKKRFAIGTDVRVTMPGMNGVVAHLDDEPHGIGGDYLHTIKTKFGERREPGCNLELIPKAQK